MSSNGKKKALIISISEYTDEYLENLDFCKKDGEKMFETLTNLGYEIQENQKIVGETNKKIMEDSIIDFFRKDVNSDDTLVFYFSGHGVLDGYGGRFFANTDLDRSLPEKDGVRFELLNEQMAKSQAEKKVAILDCCFSGGAIPNLVGKGDDVEKEAEDLGSEGLHKVFGKSQGSCILASSLSNRRSYSLEDKSFSAFTNFIIKGLDGTKDSVDENGFVTPDKLSKYVFAELQKIPGLESQKPVRNLSIAGEIILAVHKRFIKSKNMDIESFENIFEEMLDKKLNKSLESFFQKQSSLSDEEKLSEKKLKNYLVLAQFMGEAQSCFLDGKNEEALILYDKAIQIDPESKWALYGKGRVLVELERFSDAIKCFENALKTDPEFKDAKENRLKTIQKLNREDRKTAKNVENSVISKDPEMILDLNNKSKHILWVDDYPVNNQSIIEHYRSVGVDIDLAISTKMALEYISKIKYDLIISDMGRGKETDAGIQLIRSIKALHSEIPPIFIFASWMAIMRYGKIAKSEGASLTVSNPKLLSTNIDNILKL